MLKIEFEKWIERMIERGERWIQTPTGLKRIGVTRPLLWDKVDYVVGGVYIFDLRCG